MSTLNADILAEVVSASAEPVLVVRVDHPDWPVMLANAAFESLGEPGAGGKPFADVVERLVGRELALEISETIRSGTESSLAVEVGGREYLLAMKPVAADHGRWYAVYLRDGAGRSPPGTAGVQHALLKAKRRIRDLSREDAVTGLLNAGAFREILQHDLAVAAREKSAIALVVFTLDDFDAYLEVFGRHATDTCLRRVGQAIRRCLRRASDVVARLDGERLAVLSHGSDEHGVREFAARISAAVRELGLHHPRSRAGRFVTVSHKVEIIDAAAETRDARALLGKSGDSG